MKIDMTGFVEGIDCPVCGWFLQRTQFTSTPGASDHHGWHCLRCGFATCNYGSAQDRSERYITPLPHLHLHVNENLRTLVQWMPEETGWRPWRSNMRPWWPQGKSFRLEDHAVMILPVKWRGRLLWRRFDHSLTPTQSPPETAAPYPTFELALSATLEEHDAISKTEAAPPTLALLTTRIKGYEDHGKTLKCRGKRLLFGR
jgi:hypothetical protein